MSESTAAIVMERASDVSVRTSKLPIIAVAALTMLAVALIVPGGIRLSPFSDEILQWRDSVLSTYGQIITWKNTPEHSPLSYLLVKATVEAVGSDRGWALRLPSMICGVLCIPAAFFLGRRILGQWGGVLVSAMAAVDLNLVWQSRQARMYSMVMLLTFLTLQCFVKLLRGGQDPLSLWVGTTLLLVLGIWTHFSSVSLFAGLVVVTVVLVRRYRSDRAALKKITWRSAMVLIIAAAAAVPALVRARATEEYSHAISSSRMESVIHQLRLLSREVAGGTLPTLGCCALAVIGLAILWRRDRATTLVLAAIVSTCVAGLLMAAQSRPIHAARYITVAQPALWIGMSTAVVFGLTHLPAPYRAILAAGLAGSLVLQTYRSSRAEEYTSTHFIADDFARAVAFVRNRKAQGDYVLYSPASGYSRAGTYYGLTIDGNMRADVRQLHDGPASKRRALVRRESAEWRRHATWVILISPDSLRESRDPMDDPFGVMRALATAYGIAVPTSPIRNRPARRMVLVARVAKDQISYWDTKGRLRMQFASGAIDSVENFVPSPR